MTMDDVYESDEADDDFDDELTVTLARVVVVLAEDDWEGVEAWELGSGDHPT